MQFIAMPQSQSENFDERTVVRKILSGDTGAFRDIITQYQKLVSHIVFRMVSHGTDREELCQDIFIKVYRNLASFKFQAKLSTWIGRIAYNTCINFLKKKKVPLLDDIVVDKTTEGNKIDGGEALTYFSEGFSAKLPTQDEEIEVGELRANLEREIAALPIQFRALITLFHIDEFSLKDISEMMNMPEGTVKSYLFRARKILKKRLLDKYQPEDLWL